MPATDTAPGPNISRTLAPSEPTAEKKEGITTPATKPKQEETRPIQAIFTITCYIDKTCDVDINVINSLVSEGRFEWFLTAIYKEIGRQRKELIHTDMQKKRREEIDRRRAESS